MENKEIIKQNKISFNDKEIIWDYKIVPCFECPIYPLKKEFEDDPDKRNDKCWTSGCLYDREVSRMVANGIYVMMHSIYCDECDEYIDKEEIFEGKCPNCHSDLY